MGPEVKQPKGKGSGWLGATELWWREGPEEKRVHNSAQDRVWGAFICLFLNGLGDLGSHQPLGAAQQIEKGAVKVV